MSVYQFSEKAERGTWRFVKDVNTHEDVPVFVCPNCGYLCSLHGHEVDQEGAVFPMVSCPNTTACAFQRYVDLGGWPKEK